MHLNRLRETNRPARQALDPCAQRQVLTFDLLGVAFNPADADLLRHDACKHPRSPCHSV